MPGKVRENGRKVERKVMIEDMLQCLGNPTVYMRELPSIHSFPSLSLHHVRSDMEFRSTPLGPFLPSQYCFRGSYTDANRPWPTLHICIPGLRPDKTLLVGCLRLCRLKVLHIVCKKKTTFLAFLSPFTNFLHLRTSSFNFSNMEYRFARPLHV